MFLENRITFADLLAVRRGAEGFLAAEDDLFEEEDVIFPVNVGFGNDKDVVKKKFPEVFEVMALPIIHASVEGFHGLVVLGAALGFVDLVGYSFSSIRADLQLFEMLIGGCRRCLDQRLAELG